MKCPSDDCGAEMEPESRWQHWCPQCGTYVCDRASLSGVRVPARAKRYAKLRAAAQCLAGFSIIDSRDRREDDVVYSFNSHRSHRMTIGDVRAAVAALAPGDAKETTP